MFCNKNEYIELSIINLKEEALIIFTKLPEPGKVKSRLAKDLGAETACLLYNCLLEDAVALSSNLSEVKTFLVYLPSSSKSVGNTCLPEHLIRMAQRGRNMGSRMFNAFQDVFDRGFVRTVLMGVDIPDISPGLIRAAFSALRKKDAVTGPAEDGGYWLMGLNRERCLPDIFENVAWGTGDVFRATMKNFEAIGIEPHILPTLRDIDHLDDLKDFYGRALKNNVTSKTVDLIRQLGAESLF